MISAGGMFHVEHSCPRRVILRNVPRGTSWADACGERLIAMYLTRAGNDSIARPLDSARGGHSECQWRRGRGVVLSIPRPTTCAETRNVPRGTLRHLPSFEPATPMHGTLRWI